MNCHYLLYLSVPLLLLTGCATKSTQHVHDENQNELLPPRYQQKGKSTQHNRLNLLSAEAYIKRGDNPSAQNIIASLNISSLSQEQRNKLNLLQAQIQLSQGEAEQALTKLKSLDINSLQNRDQINYYQSLAFAYSLTEKHLLSAQARTQLTPLFSDNKDRQSNNKVIFNTLNLIPLPSLISHESTAPGVLKGWAALSIIYHNNKLSQDTADLQTKLQGWKQRYRQHPANSNALYSYFTDSPQSISLGHASSVALLLPATGRFSQAAKAIKKGFIAAYDMAEASTRPSLRFYDSSTYAPAELYHQAISDGADLVIGPLSKKNIQALVDSTELTTPVLALNHIPFLVKNNLFQFGLSPIDEVEQVANNALLKGVKKALLITPETNKGHRVAHSLSTYWQNNGGRILEAQTYKARGHDFSKPIKKLLNLNESRSRYNRLKRVLATQLHYNERVRKDVDAIFLSASPKTARSIYPQLRFYGAIRIPVYAASNIYTGLAHPSANRDLNKITFCDIPWLFSETYSGALSLESLRDVWRPLPNKYLRLVALGIDSFHLIDHLSEINNKPFSGATGTLSLNSQNRITRQLVCAKFSHGTALLQPEFYKKPVENNEEAVIE
jgi:outer membrane PBP1 activator LpoA protein